jgi:hypothetical protein
LSWLDVGCSTELSAGALLRMLTAEIGTTLKISAAQQLQQI